MENIEHRIKISTYVKSLRVTEGLSLREFSAKYNVSKSHLNRYELGYFDDPSLLSATNFCRTFKVPYEKFRSDFYYTDKSIKSAFELTTVIKKRFMTETENYGKDIAKNYFENNISKYADLHFIDTAAERKNSLNFYINHDAVCKDINGNEVWLCSFLHPYDFTNDAKNCNYSYVYSCVGLVASLEPSFLGSSNFIFFMTSIDLFKNLKDLKFKENTTTSLKIVLINDELNQIDSYILFGKE